MNKESVSFKFSSEHQLTPAALKKLIDDKYARLKQQLDNEQTLRTKLKHNEVVK